MLAGRPARLPAPRTSLVGREAELATTRALLLDGPARLLTLTGVGGCGKTSLALQVAASVQDAFPDGIWFVAFDEVGDEALVPDTVTSALGLREHPGQVLPDALVQYLAPRQVLLVLDNCEHLVLGCARLAERLLDDCPRLRLLATSREPLLIPGEQQRRVPPLAVPAPHHRFDPAELANSPAVHLFVERARAVTPDFHLNAANAATVVGICVRLDGLPLALELAAARVGVLTVTQILARLGDCFHLLTSGSRTGPTRQQTLRATLDWSYDLLTPPEKVVFRRLAVFVGGFDLAAVEGVCGPLGAAADRPAEPATRPAVAPELADLSMLDVLSRLVDKSLVLVEAGERGEAGYRLLDPVRQYAAGRLAAAGEAEATRTRHGDYFCHLAEAAEAKLAHPEQVEWLARLEQAHGNLRAALHRAVEQGDYVTSTRLAAPLAQLWMHHSHLHEGRRWLRLALPQPPPPGVPPGARGRALLGSARLAFEQSDFDGAVAHLEECLVCFRAADDQPGVAQALAQLGSVARVQGDIDRAMELIEASLALARRHGDRASEALALLERGTTARFQGDLAGATASLEASLRLFQTMGDQTSAAAALITLALTAIEQGTADRAAGLLIDGLELANRAGNRWLLMSGLIGVAWLAADAGEPMGAVRILATVASLSEALGDPLSPPARARVDAVRATARRQLTADADLAAWAAGRAMSLDQAIAEALAVITAPAAPAPPVAASKPKPGLRRQVEELTPREREVARLLAAGYSSDRALAARLGIAPGTAGVHVQRILEKLGFHSRWQVADWVTAQAQVRSAGA